MGKKKNFKDSIDFLTKHSGDGVSLKEYKSFDPWEFIHTGSYVYNAHISGSLRKGFPNNKIITIGGDPKTGKSFLVINGIKQAIDMGYIVYLFETEGAPDKDRFKSQLIDDDMMERIMLPEEPPETVDDILTPVIRLTDKMKEMKKKGKGDELPKVMVVVDSLTALNSTKQYKDAREGKSRQDMGTVAKDLKRMFNMMAIRCNSLGIPMICTTHVYEKDYGHFRKRVPTGGNAAIFLSSAISLLKKKDDKDDDRKRLGSIVTSELVEGRFSKPINTTFYLSFTKGMNPYFGLQNFVSWDVCGIDKGKFVDMVDLADEMLKKKVITKSNFTTKKLKSSEIKSKLSKAKAKDFKHYLEEMINKGLMSKNDDGTYSFTDKCKKKFGKDGYKPEDGKIGIPNPNSSQWIVKHLGETISVNDPKFFTSRVFTDKVIEDIDEKVIMPMYSLGMDDAPTEQDEDKVQSAEDELKQFLNQ